MQFIWAATWQNQQSDCVPNEDSDQPGNPPSLIRVFAVRMKKASALRYPFSAQRRLWSDWADAQADLSLRWAHMPFCWFCYEAAHFICTYTTIAKQLANAPMSRKKNIKQKSTIKDKHILTAWRGHHELNKWKAICDNDQEPIQSNFTTCRRYKAGKEQKHQGWRQVSNNTSGKPREQLFLSRSPPGYL